MYLQRMSLDLACKQVEAFANIQEGSFRDVLVFNTEEVAKACRMVEEIAGLSNAEFS